VHAQSIARQHCDAQDVACVFDDLILGTELKNQIGQAVHGGQGFFLYGAAGNGKTSIAERVARAFGQHIWIPRAIGVEGEVIRLYDPCKHVEAPLTDGDNAIDPAKVDRRWLRIRRPTIVAGGELTLEQLEITVNKITGISEAPLQLKSNCGILVIDDFGRQRISTTDLLNRWIVPLDRRHDYLNLPSGKTIRVPFDQLLVFSTNLEPKDLFDEAFLRRLPYKIEVPDPTESEFYKLFHFYAQRLDVGFHPTAVEHLIDAHYRRAGRPFRACHARDLLTQIRNYCQFNKLPVAMTSHAFDVAVRNYFALLG
jgi:predicted ATPase with chaperone activity